jgi:hypothetical protein
VENNTYANKDVRTIKPMKKRNFIFIIVAIALGVLLLIGRIFPK